MLHVEHVSKTFFPGTINEKKALQDLSLHLEPGDFATVIGGNGAGKSTTLNAIAGVFPIDKGKIIIDGEDITKKPEHKRAKYIGRVFQDPMLGTAAGMMIEENLSLAARRGETPGLGWSLSSDQHDRFYELLKELDLGLEDRMTAKVGLLSGGQRQALTLLMATLNRPKLLLLDEPAAGMNAEESNDLCGFVFDLHKKFDLTIFLIEHHMDVVVKLCDRITVLNFGQTICEGTPDEVIKNKCVVEAYLGEENTHA